MDASDASERNKRKSVPIKTYRDLIVWQKSMTFVTEIYKATKTLPKEEQFGLISQTRRCAVSVPSNIAEGYGRKSKRDYVRFLLVAMGSLFELQTQLQISLNLEEVRKQQYDFLFESSREVERMLSALINKLEQN